MPVVKCPRCGKSVEYSGNEFRPFCSERCKLIDFGAWADEEFAIPVDEGSISFEELNELIDASDKKNNGHVS